MSLWVEERKNEGLVFFFLSVLPERSRVGTDQNPVLGLQ
jgi:hypothetical protein